MVLAIHSICMVCRLMITLLGMYWENCPQNPSGS